MNIAWHYLDKRGAAIKALKDYPIMMSIINDARDTHATTKGSMYSPCSSHLDSLPSAHNPKAGESRLIHLINAIDVQNERYNQALEFKDWFECAWEQLSDNEQFVLREFFWDNAEDPTTAAENICDRLNIERTSAYKSKNRALDKVTLLLFGR